MSKLDLVIGGAGLTGARIAQMLLDGGRAVRVLDLRAAKVPGCESIVGDIRDRRVVDDACRGVDTVYNCSTLFSLHPRDRRRIHETNVVANRGIIAACLASGVTRLIYTSSIDVVFDGRPISRGDESLPYSARFLDAYSESKAIAEQEVLAAHQPGRLHTCALRPAGIYGPGDQQRLGALARLAREGVLRRVGDRRARFNHVYVDNVAWAHVLAGRAEGGGRAYFIVDAEPENFFDFIERFLREAGLALRKVSIPLPVAWPLAAASDAIWYLGQRWLGEHRFCRYAVAAVGRDFWFSGAAAERELGYRPIVSSDEAFRRSADWLRGEAP